MGMFYLVPGVYPREIDLSQRVAAISTSIGALVFASRKGPLVPTLTTLQSDHIDTYGEPDPAWSYGHHTAQAFHVNGRLLYNLRVVRNAKHAGLIVTNDLGGADATATFITPFPSGRSADFSVGGYNYNHLVFSTALVSLNSVAITITDGTTPVTVTTVYSGSSDATMTAIANALTTAINTNYASTHIANKKTLGKVTVLQVGSSTTDDRILRIVSPQEVTLTVTSATVTLGVSQATISIEDQPQLFEVYAENPGKWANDVGVQIRNADIGVKQKRRLTFSALLVANQKFEAVVDQGGVRTQIGPVLFNTTGAQTAADIRDEFIAALGSGADAVLQSNNLELVITAPTDGPDVFDIIDPLVSNVSGAAAIPTVTNAQTLAGIQKDDTFDLWVYNRSNQKSPLEKHKVSLNKQVDGNGQQQFIEEVINEAATKSSIIRVVFNSDNLAGVLSTLPTSSTPGATPIYWLTGGDDGEVPQASDIIAGWAKFADRSKMAVRILINGGYDDIAIQDKMREIAEKRYDCFAILDMPSASQEATAAVTHRRDVLNLNTSYAAIYTPDVKIRDEFTNLTMFVPPSGYIAAVFAYTDAVAAEWFAPAGLNRGLVKNIIGLRHEYGDAEMELLAPNQINAIIKKPGKGYPIWGAETLQSKASALSNINVRRLLITIEVSLVDALDYTVYEPNDPFTQFQVVQLCTNFLQPIKEGRGLYGYLVVSDDNNNKSYHRDMGQLNVDLILKPTIPVKYVRLSSVITKTGALFSETVGLLNAAA
jgi:phage tail sheath protein FI